MDDGARRTTNPNRVPSVLAAIDGPQAGAPRIIHPVAMLVGSLTQEAVPMYTPAEPEHITVPKTGTYMDDRGNPIALKEGDRLTLGRAARFNDLAHLVDGRISSGLSVARSAEVDAFATAPVAEGSTFPPGETPLIDPDALRQALDAGTIQLTELETIVAERKQPEPLAEGDRLHTAPPETASAGENDDVSTRQEPAPENRIEPAPENRVEPAPGNRSGTGVKPSKPATSKPGGGKSE